MLFLWASIALTCAMLTRAAHITDMLRDTDELQSGYAGGDHGLDPSVVAGPTFGILWQARLNSGDSFLSKMLVYTPAPSIDTREQRLYLFGESNTVYVLNATTGSVIIQRNYATPFSAIDASCADISPIVGITGTPVVDDATGTIYFWAKTYLNGVRTGVRGDGFNEAGRYLFYAVDAITLEIRADYPKDPQGTLADNNNNLIFNAGTALQRTALILKNNVVYAGFGGNCDTPIYYGWILGYNIVTGKLVSSWNAQSGPQAGQGGGIWMSGGGISSYGRDLYIAVGNGYGHELTTYAVRGSTNVPGTLGQSVVKLNINDDGSLKPSNFFTPFDYVNLDAADKDFGSTPYSLLDPSVFKFGGVSNMGFCAGKGAEAYFLDSNNLGGYRSGPGGANGVLQEFPISNAVFGSIGSYPLDGGYAYICPVGGPITAYAFNAASGKFSVVGQTPDNVAGRSGASGPTTTSFKGQPNTGIIWQTDVETGMLKIYEAVPRDGVLRSLKTFNGPMNKYQRPVFGDKKVFTIGGQSLVTAYGAPVNLPLDCTTLDFGSVAVGVRTTQEMRCTALTDTTINNATSSNQLFSIDPAVASSLKGKSLTAGQNFTLPVIFTPVYKSNDPKQNLSYGVTAPGPVAGTIDFRTVNTGNGNKFSSLAPINVKGRVKSQAPFLSLIPVYLNLGGVVLRNNSTPASTRLTSTATLSNVGLDDMVITGLAYRVIDDDDTDDDGPVVLSNYTSSPFAKNWSLNGLPAVGDAIKSGQRVSLDFSLDPDEVNKYYIQFYIYTNAGLGQIGVAGSADEPPTAVLGIQQWNSSSRYLNNTNVMDFGNVRGNGSSAVTLKMALTNTGASLLTVTKSKPPGVGAIQVVGLPLPEGDALEPNETHYADIIFSPPIVPLNEPGRPFKATFVLNTDDLDFEVREVNLIGTAVSDQKGPLLANGTAQYRYLGCFNQNTTPLVSRNIQLADDKMENGLCQNYCYSTGYSFATTNYGRECFCTNSIDSQAMNFLEDDTFCDLRCAGDSSQFCGGQISRVSIYVDVTRFDYDKTNSTVPDSLGASGRGGPPKMIGNYTYSGCWQENGDKLPVITTSDEMTLDLCVNTCTAKGLRYSGVEYGGECRCANTLPSAFVQVAEDLCSMTCRGNAQQPCGAGSRLTFYANDAFPKPPTSTSFTSSSTKLSSVASSGRASTVVSANVSASTISSVISPSATGMAKNQALIYAGCYYDNGDSRTFPTGLSVKSNSIESCAAACSASNFAYSGTEYGVECWCSSTPPTSALSNACDVPCPGAADEICGGGNALSVVRNSAFMQRYSYNGTIPSGATDIDGYAVVGCFQESPARALKFGQEAPPTGWTSRSCLAKCKSLGFQLAATEYANECYCDNTFDYSGGGGLISSACTMDCAGDNTDTCGGSNAINLYQRFPSMASSSALPSSSAAPRSTSSASKPGTVTLAISASSASTSSSPSTAVASTSRVILPTTSSSRSSSASLTSRTTTLSASFSVSSQSGPLQTIGCYADNTNARTFAYKASVKGNSVEVCAAACSQNNYVYSGTESGTDCWCSSSAPSSYLSSSCTKACPGNPGQSCGGINALSVVKDSQFVLRYNYNGTIPNGAPIINGFASVGCYEDAARRVLKRQESAPQSGWTTRLCIDRCSSLGFTLAGTEYANECFCDHVFDYTGTNGRISGACTMPCTGNKTEICGGSNAINLYQLPSSSATATATSASTFLTVTSYRSSSGSFLASTISYGGTSTSLATSISARILSTTAATSSSSIVSITPSISTSSSTSRRSTSTTTGLTTTSRSSIALTSTSTMSSSSPTVITSSAKPTATSSESRSMVSSSTKSSGRSSSASRSSGSATPEETLL